MNKYDLLPFIEKQNEIIYRLREEITSQAKSLEEIAREFHESIKKPQTPLKIALLTTRHMEKLRATATPDAITELSTVYSDLSMLREEIANSDISLSEQSELFDTIDTIIKKALVLINVLNLVNGIVLPEYFTSLAKTIQNDIDSNTPSAEILSRGLILKLGTLASQIPNNT